MTWKESEREERTNAQHTSCPTTQSKGKSTRSCAGYKLGARSVQVAGSHRRWTRAAAGARRTGNGRQMWGSAQEMGSSQVMQAVQEQGRSGGDGEGELAQERR